MGIVSSSISPAAGIITGTQNAENSARSSQAATANTNQIISPSSSAAIVTLSSDSKSRGVSTGEGRSVDASFEKQESGGGGEVSTKEKSSGKGQVVNVAA